MEAYHTHKTSRIDEKNLVPRASSHTLLSIALTLGSQQMSNWANLE